MHIVLFLDVQSEFIADTAEDDALLTETKLFENILLALLDVDALLRIQYALASEVVDGIVMIFGFNGGLDACGIIQYHFLHQDAVSLKQHAFLLEILKGGCVERKRGRVLRS